MMNARWVPLDYPGLPPAWAMLAVTMAAGPLPAQVHHPDQISYPPLRTISMPQTERIELSNGLVVYLLEDHDLPWIDIQLQIRVGSSHDPADKAGLARLTATVMQTGGAGERSGAEVDRFLADRAAELSIDVARDIGHVRLSFLTEHLSDVFPVLADILRSPRLEAEHIEAAKVQWQGDIATFLELPWFLARREFLTLVYGAQSPYGRRRTSETLNAITEADVVAFHEQYFHRNHIILGVTGDFQRGAMLALIEREFGDWRPGRATLPKGFQVASAAAGKVYYVEKNDVTQTNFRLGHLGTTFDDPDYFAVEIMNTIFGSRLFNVLRSERGLTRDIWGRVGADYAYPGVFEVGGATSLESTGEALEAAIAEIERMNEGTVTEEELSYAKESFLNSFIFNFDTPKEVVSRQMLYEYYGYPADFLQNSRDRIEAVTRDDVRRAAQRMLHPDRLLILCVGDASKFDRPLSDFGDVVAIDVNIPDDK